MEQLTRESYMERELAKWNEKYEIGFEQEFEIRALISLQYQFASIPEDHIKAKADIINTISQIKRNLNLKMMKNEKQENVLFVVRDRNQLSQVSEFLKHLLDGKIFRLHSNSIENRIETKNHKINIQVGKLADIRGMKADYLFDLTNNKGIDEYFKNQSKF